MHQPAAGHWRFALELEHDRSAAGFFFVARFHDPIESEWRSLQPQTLKRNAAPLHDEEE
jgi:hypothetical protein